MVGCAECEDAACNTGRGDALQSAITKADEAVAAAQVEVEFEVDGGALAVLAGVYHAAGVAGRLLELAAYFGPPLLALPSLLAVRYCFPSLGEPALDAWWTWILWAVESNGPALIKWGQWAANRRDLFPPEFCKQFSKLHEMAPMHAWHASQATLEAEFGADWGQSLTLDQEPIGSGCIAQVYKGVLVDAAPGGLPAPVDVAVKIVHPEVRSYVERDIAILRCVASFVDMFEAAHWLGISGALAEFEELISRQLDLTDEAGNLDRFTANFSGDARICFPRPVPRWVSSSVLVETYEPGVSLGKLVEAVAAKPGHDSFSGRGPEVGQLLADALMRMLFVHNFAHGDLHPGNILVRGIDGQGWDSELEVVLLDAGIATTLSDRDHVNFRDLFSAICRRDGRRAGELMLERSPEQRCQDPEAFVTAIEGIVDEALSSGLSLKNVQIGSLLGRVLSLACDHQVRLESNFTQVALSIMVLEGVGRQLDPDQDLRKTAMTYLARKALGLG